MRLEQATTSSSTIPTGHVRPRVGTSSAATAIAMFAAVADAREVSTQVIRRAADTAVETYSDHIILAFYVAILIALAIVCLRVYRKPTQEDNVNVVRVQADMNYYERAIRVTGRYYYHISDPDEAPHPAHDQELSLLRCTLDHHDQRSGSGLHRRDLHPIIVLELSCEPLEPWDIYDNRCAAIVDSFQISHGYIHVQPLYTYDAEGELPAWMLTPSSASSSSSTTSIQSRPASSNFVRRGLHMPSTPAEQTGRLQQPTTSRRRTAARASTGVSGTTTAPSAPAASQGSSRVRTRSRSRTRQDTRAADLAEAQARIDAGLRSRQVSLLTSLYNAWRRTWSGHTSLDVGRWRDVTS